MSRPIHRNNAKICPVERWWRVVGAYRAAALLFAGAIALSDRDRYSRPALAAALLAGMAVWTALTLRRGSRTLAVTEVGLAAGLVLATRAVYPPHEIAGGAATLPGPWVAASVLAAAVAFAPSGGLAAAVVVGAAGIAERGSLPQITAYGIALLLIAGGLAGYVVALSRRAEAATAQAARVEAAAEERDRLARDIHDSVLQVLALVARRGAALGGEAGDLARLAGEQEAALRALVSTPSAREDAQGEVDVRALLEPLAGARVTVSCPAEPVRLPAPTARELAAATTAALDNVERHAGADAHAWVLVEDDGAEVVVGIRDDGAGFDPGRIDAARRDGRLGVTHSIVGRMQSIGGTASVDSAVGRGTEVELRVRR